MRRQSFYLSEAVKHKLQIAWKMLRIYGLKMQMDRKQARKIATKRQKEIALHENEGCLKNR